MSNVVKHGFQSAKVDGADATLVRPSNWNAEHTFAGGAQGDVLLRDTGQSDGVSWGRSGAFNFTFNGDFEIWGVGVSSPPSGWPLTGAGASAAKNTTAGQFKFGTASVSLTRAGTDCYLFHGVNTFAGFGPVARWQGKTVTFGCWVRATVAARVRVAINDGVGTSNSSYHTGGGAFEFLSVTRTLDAAATKVEPRLVVDTGDTTAQFDGAILVIGTVIHDEIPSGWRGSKYGVNVGSADGQLLAAGGTTYLGPRFAGSALNINGFRVPNKSVIRKMRVTCGAAPGGGQTFTYTLAESGADQSVTATISGASSSEADDVVNEAEVAEATFLQVKVVASGGAASTIHAATFEVEEIP